MSQFITIQQTTVFARALVFSIQKMTYMKVSQNFGCNIFEKKILVVINSKLSTYAYMSSDLNFQ